jgi:hypothetical protein
VYWLAAFDRRRTDDVVTFIVGLPKPKVWQDFERKTRVLFACILADPNAQLHGRSGQLQHGVDILGYRDKDRGQLVGIQCKKKFHDAVSVAELEAELKKAKRFAPAITEFILVTTAPRDARIQRRALELTQSLAVQAPDPRCCLGMGRRRGACRGL